MRGGEDGHRRETAHSNSPNICGGRLLLLFIIKGIINILFIFIHLVEIGNFIILAVVADVAR